MATFDPSNPFNIRGVRISPGNPDGNSAKNDINYYVILLDVVQNQVAGGGVNLALFVPLNFQETGNTLTYGYNGVLQVPVDPSSDPNQVLTTLALPIYTNQNIDKPNEAGDNLFVTVDYTNTNGQAGVIKGNPNARKPPVFPVLAASVQGFQVDSISVPGMSWIGFMLNTNLANTINCGNIFSVGPQSDGTYDINFCIQNARNASSNFPWENLLPGQSHGVAAIAVTPGNQGSYPSIIFSNPEGNTVAAYTFPFPANQWKEISL